MPQQLVKTVLIGAVVCVSATFCLAEYEYLGKVNVADPPDDKSSEAAKEKVKESRAEEQKDKAESRSEKEPAKDNADQKRAAALKTIAEAQKAAAARAARQRAAPVNAVNQNAAMVEQWKQQYRPILLSELLFIRQMCELAKEQRPKIKAAGEASLTEAAQKFADFQMNGRVVRVNMDNSPDPRETIRNGLAKALRQVLTSEQLERYNKEFATRSEHHKRATILSVVARLDTALSLTAQQRDQISESLTTKWQDKWEKWLVIHQYGDQYFPMIPEEHLIAHLSSDQQAVWRSLQKIDVNFWGGNVAQQQDDADWWDGEPERRPVPAPQPGGQALGVPAVFKALGRIINGNR